MPCIPVPPGYTLDYTLLPSYTLPLFTRIGRDAYRKEYGVSSGSILWLEDGFVCCEGCRIEELVSWSGVWATIRTSRGVIGLSVSPWDDIHVFAAAVASQNTRYDRVVVWMRKLYPLIDDATYHKIADIAASLGSYQVRRAAEALEVYVHIRLSIATGGLWERRSKLLLIRGVGVKTAHAYLLFTTHASYPVPIDRHAVRMLGLSGILPRKEACIRYPCPRCPLRQSCVVWRLYREHGLKAGLVQTRAWLEAQNEKSIRRLFKAVTLRDS